MSNPPPSGPPPSGSTCMGPPPGGILSLLIYNSLNPTSLVHTVYPCSPTSATGGSLDLTSLFTLTGDGYYNNITIEQGGSIDTRGYNLYLSGLLNLGPAVDSLGYGPPPPPQGPTGPAGTTIQIFSTGISGLNATLSSYTGGFFSSVYNASITGTNISPYPLAIFMTMNGVNYPINSFFDNTLDSSSSFTGCACSSVASDGNGNVFLTFPINNGNGFYNNAFLSQQVNSTQPSTINIGTVQLTVNYCI